MGLVATREDGYSYWGADWDMRRFAEEAIWTSVCSGVGNGDRGKGARCGESTGKADDERGGEPGRKYGSQTGREYKGGGGRTLGHRRGSKLCTCRAQFWAQIWFPQNLNILPRCRRLTLGGLAGNSYNSQRETNRRAKDSSYG